MKRLNVKFEVVLFFCCYTLILASIVLSNVNCLSGILNFMSDISMIILLVTSIINIHHSKKKEFILFLLILIIASISFVVSKDKTILRLLLLIFSAKNIEFDSLVKYDLKLKIFFLLLVLVLYYLNLTDNYIMYRSDGTIRSSMGFPHPNFFGTFVMSILVEYLYLKKKKIGLIDLFITILLIFIVDVVSNSRTSELCMFITTFCLFLNSKRIIKLESTFHKKVITNMFLILSVVSFLLGHLFKQGNPIALIIDSLLSGRIKLISKFFDAYPITFFGNEIKIVTTEMSHILHEEIWVLDNAYSMLMLKFGFLIFIFFAFFSKKLYSNAAKLKNDKIQIIFTIYLLYGLMETGLYKIEFNVFLLYFVTFFNNNVRAKKNEFIPDKVCYNDIEINKKG